MNSTNNQSHLHKNNQSESGSVLVIILIAVALFGSLSYVVANMMRADSGLNAISEQQAGLYAAEILGYATTLRRTIQDLKISNGCDNAELSFETPPFDNSDGYRNTNSPSDFSCHIFHPDGGGVSPAQPKLAWQDEGEAVSRSGITEKYLMTANICIPGVGTGDTSACGPSGDSDSELIMIVPWINPVLCRTLNKRLGVSDDTMPDFGVFGQFSVNHSDKFVGTFPTSKNTAGSNVLIQSQKSFCAQDVTTASPPQSGYHFYSTLVAR